MFRTFIQERPEVVIVMSIPEAKRFFRFVRDHDKDADYDWLYNAIFAKIHEYEMSQEEDTDDE